MKLSELGLLKTVIVAFIGELLETSLTTSEGEPYYLGKLLNPITVRCSSDKDILPIETDELYIRQRDVESDEWIFIDEKDPSKGYYIKGYKTDFSKGQQICIYQDTTIAEWSKGNRQARGLERRSNINDAIKKRMADRTAAAATK